MAPHECCRIYYMYIALQVVPALASDSARGFLAQLRGVRRVVPSLIRAGSRKYAKRASTSATAISLAQWRIWQPWKNLKVWSSDVATLSVASQLCMRPNPRL